LDPRPAPPQQSPPPGPAAPPERPPWGHLDFAARSATEQKRPGPRFGWRRAVYQATFGLVNLGASPAERQEDAYEAAIGSALRGNYKVGVLGKGGVGKTTVAASVGSIFAELRRQDRVVAVDADTAFGRLGSRIDPRANGSYWELASDKNLRSFSDVTSRVGSNSAGLYVLAGEPTAGPRRVLDPALYREATSRLDHHFSIAIIDCGSTMDAPVTQEALSDLDALIVVSSPWADGAAAAAQTMGWLAARGRTGLLQRTVVVLNDSDGHSDKRTRAVLADQFLGRGQKVVEVPFDPHLRPGGVIDVRSELGRHTRRKFLEITATVAGFFASRPEAPRR
jgi:MinD-like ATPase involved in chromosome partitioning or flagellar assembly